MFNKKEKLEIKTKKSKPKVEISKNEKILLGVIAAGVVGYCSYAFVFKPLNAKIEPLEKEVQTLQSSVNGRKNIDEQLKETKSILSEREKEYDQVVIKVPETDRYPELSRNLHNTAFNNNVKISSVTFGQPVVVNYGTEAAPAAAPAPAEGQAVVETNPENANKYNDLRTAKNGFYKYTVTVNYEGSFMHVMNFVKAMERQEQILELTNISVAEQNKTEAVDNTESVKKLKADITKSEQKIKEINAKIEKLMAEKAAATDAMVKAEIQEEIQTQQIERMAEQSAKDSLENALKDVQNTETKGESYSVTGGTITFDYYTRGEIKQENHNFNGGKYGKNDIFK